MNQKEFFEELSHTKNWELDSIGRIRNSKCGVCPISYVANKKKRRVYYFDNSEFDKAAQYLGMSAQTAVNIASAADGLIKSNNGERIRRKLIKVCKV